MKGIAAVVLVTLTLQSCSEPTEDGPKLPDYHLTAETPVEILLQALTDERPLNREQAANLLGLTKNVTGVEPLIQTLKDHDPTVRKAAVNALGQLGDRRATDPLISLLKDNASITPQGIPIKVCCESASALGDIRDPRAVPALIEALDGWEARDCAVYALGEIGDSRALEPLIKILLTGSWGSNSMDSSTVESENWLASASLRALKKLKWQPKTEVEQAFALIASEDKPEITRRAPEIRRLLIAQMRSACADGGDPNVKRNALNVAYRYLLATKIDANRDLVQMLAETGDIRLANMFLAHGNNELKGEVVDWGRAKGYELKIDIR